MLMLFGILWFIALQVAKVRFIAMVSASSYYFSSDATTDGSALGRAPFKSIASGRVFWSTNADSDCEVSRLKAEGTPVETTPATRQIPAVIRRTAIKNLWRSLGTFSYGTQN